MLVTTLPTSTTNMTGLPIILRGLSLSTEPMAAPRTMFKSQIDLRLFDVLDMNSSEGLSSTHLQVLKNWTKTERGEKGQCAQNDNHADQQNAEQRSGDRERANRRRNVFLLGQAAGNRQHRNLHQEAPAQHGEAKRNVVPSSVRVEPAEG